MKNIICKIIYRLTGKFICFGWCKNCDKWKSVNSTVKTLSTKKKKIEEQKSEKNLFTKSKGVKSTKLTTSNLSTINLLILRDTFTNKSTIGKLYVNGEEFCDTLENPYIDNERSISCIPVGEYGVRIRLPRESATREYIHLLVQDVPNRDYILFHRGNKPEHTRGCILVGQTRQQDFVGNSRLAMDLLIKEIVNLGGENIKLIIKNK